MPPRSAKILIGLSLATLAVFGLRTIGNADFWLHLALGRSIVETGIPHTDPLTYSLGGQPWISTTWLYDFGLYRLWKMGGAAGAIITHVACAVAAFMLLLPGLLRRSSAAAISAALLMSAWLLAPVFQPGPHLAALFLAALFIRILGDGHLKALRMAALLAVQVIWANTHPSFLLGPVLCVLSAISTALSADNRGRKRASSGVHPGLAAVLCVIACAISPYGWRQIPYALSMAGNVGFLYTQEWISPFSWLFVGRGGARLFAAALAVGVAGFILRQRPYPLPLLVLAGGVAFAACTRPQIYQGWMALLTFPFLAISFHSIGKWTGRTAPVLASLPLRNTTVLVVAILQLGTVTSVMSGIYYRQTGSASAIGFGVEHDVVPEAACAVLERPDFPSRLIHFARDGGYLAWRLGPGRTFTDQRAELFGGRFYQRLADALSSPDENMSTFEEAWEPEAILLNCCLPGAPRAMRKLMTDRRWALIYFDGLSAVLIKPTERYQSLLDDTALHDLGLEVLENEHQAYERSLNRPLKQSPSAHVIGGALTLFDMERYAEALPLYRSLAQGTRNLPDAWLGAGVSLLHLGRFDESVGVLSESVRLFPNDIRLWLWLSRAWTQAGRMQAGRSAYDRAMSINASAALDFGEPTAGGPADR